MNSVIATKRRKTKPQKGTCQSTIFGSFVSNLLCLLCQPFMCLFVVKFRAIIFVILLLVCASLTYAQLTASERRGKQIYLRGESPSGRKITPMLGDIDVPASTVTCAGCHGLRGEGKTEGGVTAGNLTWTNLVKAYGHTHPSGRKHGPFDERLFTRSLVQGLDPAGNKLAVAMPRYEMSPEDIADLVAYLKRIEAEREPGLTETSIKVGTILPKQGALAEIG